VIEVGTDVASDRIESRPAPRFEPRPSVAPAPVPEAPTPRDAPELPRVSLELPPESDLVLVETSHDRVQPGQAQAEADAPRARRARPPRADTPEEPLQMVETSHKDSTPPAE
jgi:hypothetical protein